MGISWMGTPRRATFTQISASISNPFEVKPKDENKSRASNLKHVYESVSPAPVRRLIQKVINLFPIK